MLTIRLLRGGKKNMPQYKVVLAKKTTAAQKQFVEVLGSYNPHTKALVIKDQERLNYWLKDQHVEVSETVHNLFVTNNLIDSPKVKAFTLPKKEVAPEETPAAPEATAEPAEVAATEEPATQEENPAA